MSLVDVALIALALLFALSGFRQGLIIAATSFVGFFGGAVLGAQLSGPLADQIAESSVTRVFVALVVVLTGALLGQLLAGLIGRAVRRRVTWEPARMVDAVAGAGLSSIAVLLVAWVVGPPGSSPCWCPGCGPRRWPARRAPGRPGRCGSRPSCRPSTTPSPHGC